MKFIYSITLSEVLTCYWGSITDLLICWGDGLYSTTVRVITSRSDLKCCQISYSGQFDQHYRAYWSHITLAISRWRSPKKSNYTTVGGQFCFFIQSETFHYSNFVHYIKLLSKVRSFCSMIQKSTQLNLKFVSDLWVEYHWPSGWPDQPSAPLSRKPDLLAGCW